ncbi:MAG: hypothetical protein HKN42_19475 [Granulosicoccus sp.]|nr:hypothetical protein [Granulosicoccus sp.]
MSMSARAVSDLSLILAPISATDFFRQYWEQTPIHIGRNDPRHFSHVLQLAQIESLLSTQELRYPAVQLIRRQAPVALSSYADGADTIIPLRLAEQYRDGATIVISQAQRLITSLADFRRRVQCALQLRCQTNLYLSPAESQGFDAHYDSHDVFILQVQGSKTFNFYAGGVVLPYDHESFDPERHKAGELTESITVQAGDTLYIPRGIMHDAVARDEASLHITLGVYALTLRDTLLEMADRLTHRDPRYRCSLWNPPAWLDADGPVASAAATPRSMDVLLSSPSFRLEDQLEAVCSLLDDIALDSAQQCAGSLAGEMPAFCTRSVISLKEADQCTAQRQGSTVRYRLPGQVLEFPDPLGNALDQLLQRQRMVVGDWDGLSEDQQLALCDRLWRANLIELDDV